MDIRRLIKMANDIGTFFESEADRSQGVIGVADHLKKFWDPRMRRQILEHVEHDSGEGLKPIVLEALRSFGKEIVSPGK